MKVGFFAPSLRMARSVIDAIDASAIAAYPSEACGVLVGRRSEQTIEVLRAVACRNRESRRAHDRYQLDPDDFNTADTEARSDGLDIVGIWHSHPDHPASPSSTDVAAAWPEFAYLIVSVAGNDVVERRSWQLADNRFIEQEMEERPKCPK